MRLVLVGPAYPLRGGIAHYNSSLYQELSAEHRVEIISFRRLYPKLLFPGTTQFDEGDDAFEAPVRELVDPLKPWSWAAAARATVEAQPDAVIFQWWHSFFAPAYRRIAAGIGRRSSATRVLVCHNLFPHERPPKMLRFLERALVGSMLRHFDQAIVHATREQERLAVAAPDLPVNRVPHPTYRFYGRWATGRRTESAKLRLLYFGTVRKYKGLDVFLRALKSISERVQVEATIAGECYIDEAAMRALAHDLGVTGLIDWRSHYVRNEDVAPLFEGADLVVVPYIRATQSGVIALAFGFGVPVVASDIAGLSEVVRHGETGLLVPPADPQALADAVVAFHEEGASARYRSAIRREAPSMSWSRVADVILNSVSSSHGR